MGKTSDFNWKTKDCQFDNFVITGGTVCCHLDNLRCYQWQQSYQINVCLLSMSWQAYNWCCSYLERISHSQEIFSILLLVIFLLKRLHIVFEAPLLINWNHILIFNTDPETISLLTDSKPEFGILDVNKCEMWIYFFIKMVEFVNLIPMNLLKSRINSCSLQLLFMAQT